MGRICTAAGDLEELFARIAAIFATAVERREPIAAEAGASSPA